MIEETVERDIKGAIYEVVGGQGNGGARSFLNRIQGES
jgi:hypothetical protein